MGNPLDILVNELHKLKNIKYNYAEGKVKIYQVIAGFHNNYNTMEISSKNGKYICHTEKVTMLKRETITKEYSYLVPLIRYIKEFSRGGL